MSDTDNKNGISKQPQNNVVITIVHQGITQDSYASSSPHQNDIGILENVANGTKNENLSEKRSEKVPRVSRSLDATLPVGGIVSKPTSCNTGDATLSQTQEYLLIPERSASTHPARSMVILSMENDGVKNEGRFSAFPVTVVHSQNKANNSEFKIPANTGSNGKVNALRINLSNNKVAPSAELIPKTGSAIISDSAEAIQQQPHQILSTTSSNSLSSTICRICHDNPSKLELMMPCRCKGSMGMVHLSCLERWLSESGKNTCEICGHEYHTIRKPKFTGFNALFAWIRKPLTANDTRNLFFDIACFFILTPLAAISSWLCVNGAQTYTLDHHFYSEKRIVLDKSEPSNNTWTAVGLLSLTATLLIAYLVWFFIAIRYHRNVFREWQQRNFVVTIVPFDASQSPALQPNNIHPPDQRNNTAEDANNNEDVFSRASSVNASCVTNTIEDELIFASVYENDSRDRLFALSTRLPETHNQRNSVSPNNNLDDSGQLSSSVDLDHVQTYSSAA